MDLYIASLTLPPRYPEDMPTCSTSAFLVVTALDFERHGQERSNSDFPLALRHKPVATLAKLMRKSQIS